MYRYIYITFLIYASIKDIEMQGLPCRAAASPPAASTRSGLYDTSTRAHRQQDTSHTQSRTPLRVARSSPVPCLPTPPHRRLSNLSLFPK